MQLNTRSAVKNRSFLYLNISIFAKLFQYKLIAAEYYLLFITLCQYKWKLPTHVVIDNETIDNYK